NNMRSGSQQRDHDPSRGWQWAQQASKNLRQALRQIDKPDGSRLDEALEQFADRTGEMLRDQQRIEQELYKALSQSGQGNESSFRFGGRSNIGQREIRDLVEAKQRMASELSELQG